MRKRTIAKKFTEVLHIPKLYNTFALAFQKERTPITTHTNNMVPIVQLVRASDCGSECRGFESHWAPKENKRKSLINKEFPLFLFSYSHSRSFYKQLLNITSNTKCFSTKLLKLKTRHYNKATFISTDEEIRKKPPTLVCRRLKEFFFLEIYRTLERCGI